MRYPMPNYPCEFEIPDDWLTEADMVGFTRAAAAYRSTAAAVAVPLRDIEPPYRTPWTPKDWRGFDHDRLVRVLSWIATDAQIEPVPMVTLPRSDFLAAPYRYRICDGYHRFYASIAAGFEQLPAVIVGGEVQ
jgi:ParB-like chromosome segregation protein Spo0J